MDDTASFLNVERSVTGRRWVDRLDPMTARQSAAITQTLDIPEILARIVAGRGVGVDAAPDYLNPTLRALMPEPYLLVDMEPLAARIAEAIRDGEQVALFGDYDVDGACSVALMLRFLRHFGLKPLVHIPDRIFEGYGPNIPAIDGLIASGATLIITLDCGTASHAAIDHARAQGVEMLVIDHHIAPHQLPNANALVNPNRPDDISGLGALCAAGVTFMVVVAIARILRQAGETGLPNLMNHLDLVALATVCDVVPLIGLNRAFVLRGIEAMHAGANAGLTALSIAARVSGPPNPYHLGFLLGPRINAGGRIGDAALGARLLATDDPHEAMTVAGRLDELNGERQRIERAACEDAMAAADAEIGDGEGPPVIVTASTAWHQGVVGLVAARLRERFDRPAFAIALRPDGSGTGSGRSMPEVDLGAAVVAAVEEGLIAKGGGHAMAAGVSLDPGQIGPFRAFLSEMLGEAVAKARRRTDLKIDAALTARGAHADMVRQVERAGPYGSGNPTPVFAFPGHTIRYPEIVGEGGHVRFVLSSGDGARLKGIAFRAAGTPIGESLLRAQDGAPIHICGMLGLDHWQGRESVQFRALDIAIPGR